MRVTRIVVPVMMAIEVYAQAPVISPHAIVNAASLLNPALPGGAIARGSLFSISGQNLGPPALAQPLAAPFATSLSGVSIRITQGSAGLVDAIPVSVIANNITAILPSNAPLGLASVQVTNNGLRSNPSPVTIVDTGFGAFANLGSQGPATMLECQQRYRSAAELSRDSGPSGTGCEPVGHGSGASHISGQRYSGGRRPAGAGGDLRGRRGGDRQALQRPRRFSGRGPNHLRCSRGCAFGLLGSCARSHRGRDRQQRGDDGHQRRWIALFRAFQRRGATTAQRRRDRRCRGDPRTETRRFPQPRGPDRGPGDDYPAAGDRRSAALQSAILLSACRNLHRVLGAGRSVWSRRSAGHGPFREIPEWRRQLLGIRAGNASDSPESG